VKGTQSLTSKGDEDLRQEDIAMKSLHTTFHVFIGFGGGWLSSLGWSWQPFVLIGGCVIMAIGIVGLRLIKSEGTLKNRSG